MDATANNGQGTVNFALGPSGANAVFTVKFCPYGGNGQNCFDNGTVQADANGGGSSHFTFSRQGTFAGTFFLTQNGTNILNTGMDPSSSGVSFEAALLPFKSITGSGFGGPGTGTVVASGGTMTFTLTGALANHTYSAGGCSGSVCGNLTLITDANGNGKVAAPLSQIATAFGGFGISDSSGIAFHEGFIVQ